MALLDVTALLSDPDFADAITVTRVTTTIDSHGRSVATTATVSAIAVMQPATAAQLDVIPEAERSRDSVAIYTTFALRMAVAGGEADRVAWRGKTFRVANVKDFLNYGAGHVEAIGVAMEPV